MWGGWVPEPPEPRQRRVDVDQIPRSRRSQSRASITSIRYGRCSSRILVTDTVSESKRVRPADKQRERIRSSVLQHERMGDREPQESSDDRAGHQRESRHLEPVEPI